MLRAGSFVSSYLNLTMFAIEHQIATAVRPILLKMVKPNVQIFL